MGAAPAVVSTVSRFTDDNINVGGIKLPTPRIDNPINTAIDVGRGTTSLLGENIIKSPGVQSLVKRGGVALYDAVAPIAGQETSAQIRSRKEAEAAAGATAAQNASNQERSQLYEDIVGGNQLDSLSQGELLEAFRNGQSSGEIASRLSQAREGKGIYAVRRINQNQKQLTQVRPGRGQLSQRYSLIS